MKRLLLAIALPGPLVLVDAPHCRILALVSVSLLHPSPTRSLGKRKAQIEGAVDTAITALNGYRRACIQGTADKPCRDNIAAIQKYTRQMPPLLIQLRGFVDNNQQLNAVAVYNQLLALYSTFKTTAGNLGYNVGKSSMSAAAILALVGQALALLPP